MTEIYFEGSASAPDNNILRNGQLELFVKHKIYIEQVSTLNFHFFYT